VSKVLTRNNSRQQKQDRLNPASKYLHSRTYDTHKVSLRQLPLKSKLSQTRLHGDSLDTLSFGAPRSAYDSVVGPNSFNYRPIPAGQPGPGHYGDRDNKYLDNCSSQKKQPAFTTRLAQLPTNLSPNARPKVQGSPKILILSPL
jgi:hypothetical protein